MATKTQEFELFEKWLGWKPHMTINQDYIVINQNVPVIDLYFEGYESYQVSQREGIEGFHIFQAGDDFDTLRGVIIFNIPEAHHPEWKFYVDQQKSKKAAESKSRKHINITGPISSTLAVETKTKLYDFLKAKFENQDKLNEFVEEAIVEKMYGRGGFDNMLADYFAIPKGIVKVQNLALEEIKELNNPKYEACKRLLKEKEFSYLRQILLEHPNRLFCVPNSGVSSYLALLKFLATLGLEPGMEVQNTD